MLVGVPNLTHVYCLPTSSSNHSETDKTKPTTAPSNNPDISDTSTVFPLGKIGRSTLHPCKARDLPRDVVIEIGPSDLPIDNLNTGGGHDMWMTEVLLNSQTGPVYGPRPISALYIPGSHDAATWTAMVSNAKCQNNSLYEQLKLGIRSFDLRLFPDTEGDTRKFQPFHGILKRTAIPWNEDLNNIGSSMTTILHQLDTFYKETAGSAEFVILDLVLGGWARAPSFIVPSDVTPTQTQVDNFWKLMHYYFNDKAMALPPQGGQLPTLASVHGSPRRIILRMGQKNDRRPSDSAGLQVVTFYNDFVWDPNQGFRSGPGWNGETYEQSRYGDSKQEAILSFNEKFMQDNKTTLIKRDLFCGYQCQVTPSLPDRAPADRNFAPEFNPRLQQALNTDLWLDCANIISGDFFDGPTIERIISMHWKRL
jgi:hypothetical protein